MMHWQHQSNFYQNFFQHFLTLFSLCFHPFCFLATEWEIICSSCVPNFAFKIFYVLKHILGWLNQTLLVIFANENTIKHQFNFFYVDHLSMVSFVYFFNWLQFITLILENLFDHFDHLRLPCSRWLHLFFFELCFRNFLGIPYTFRDFQKRKK